MGLLYTFPTSTDDVDHVEIRKTNPSRVSIHSHGLPLIFWGYGAAILTVYSFMALGIWGPLTQLGTHPDQLSQLVYLLGVITVIGAPLLLVSFYFYQKTISVEGDTLRVLHRIFIFKWSHRYQLAEQSPLSLHHFLDSPNMARIQDEITLKGFQNKGYFILRAQLANGKQIDLDRHSVRAMLLKTKQILES